MVCFQIKNPNFGKFLRVLQWKILVYFVTIWSILQPWEIFHGHLVYFVVIWYIFPVLVFCPKINLASLVHITIHSELSNWKRVSYQHSNILAKNCVFAGFLLTKVSFFVKSCQLQQTLGSGFQFCPFPSYCCSQSSMDISKLRDGSLRALS
jgi:hypothetical protein